MGAYIALLDFPGLIFTNSPSVSKLWMVRVENRKRAQEILINIP